MNEFVDCALEKYRQDILDEDFGCHAVWWRELFPPGSRECTKVDVGELIRLKYETIGLQLNSHV